MTDNYDLLALLASLIDEMLTLIAGQAALSAAMTEMTDTAETACATNANHISHDSTISHHLLCILPNAVMAHYSGTIPVTAEANSYVGDEMPLIRDGSSRFSTATGMQYTLSEDSITTLFKDAGYQGTLDIVNLESFLASQFSKRYDTAWLIADLTPYQSVGNYPDTNYTDTNAISQSLIKAAVRLRDVFATQGIISASLPLPLAAYGFSAVSLKSAVPNRQINPLENHTHHSSNLDTAPDNPLVPQYHHWQFNLYDYKALPDWLNAKYWANPERFDKHRW